MPAWIYNGSLLWLALMGASFTLPILRWTVAPGRWSFMRQSIGGVALTMAWTYLIIGAEMLFGFTK